MFDTDLECVYRGRFDETRPNMEEPSGIDLSNALDSLILGGKITKNQYPSIGCNIKWK